MAPMSTSPNPTASSRPADRRQRVQSAEMGLSILKALARLGGAASLTATAAEVGESPAKVHRYLASLCQQGFVGQSQANQHYFLAQEAISIGLAALRQCDPIRLGEASLVRLRESLEVTAFLAVMGNKGATVLRIEEPTLPVTVNMRAGSVLPTLWSAAGRIFLSFSNDRQILELAEQELAQAPAERRAQLPGPQPIEQLRQQVRNRGWAVVQDSMLRGISALAAPIFDSTGKVCAALATLGATGGFDLHPEGAICPALLHEARVISRAMGCLTQHHPE